MPADASSPARGADGSTPGLEARLDRLDAIVRRLERDDIELDEALALFEEGIEHLRQAQHVLQDSELRIHRLLQDAEGGALLEPLDPDD
jgi:exodeoxyribonuclease VII small subunit